MPVRLYTTIKDRLKVFTDWETEYLAAAVRSLAAGGFEIEDEIIDRLSEAGPDAVFATTERQVAVVLGISEDVMFRFPGLGTIIDPNPSARVWYLTDESYAQWEASLIRGTLQDWSDFWRGV
jgi:hypothetical protein